ncbi:hypothetical protein [Seonamhaeicola sp.]|uniref:hypothetical protein n=1 Tax=Seonamhaeicola sp. TaxID=1912245 RepID=UPI002604E860|nr:hypothetical protein [Seonamhaeicola sp.]
MKTNYFFPLSVFSLLILIASCNKKAEQKKQIDNSIPFEVFAKFERVEGASPLITVDPPEWAAAAHTLIVKDTIHYFWSKRDEHKFWDLRHSYAPVENPERVVHDSRNPILSPPETGMDSKSIEYPCPFYNPLDKKFYMYYLVKENIPGTMSPKQTGLLVSDGDMGDWKRVVDHPVIYSEFEHEKIVAGHTAVAIVKDTIHIIYTSLISYDHNPAVCLATAPLNDPKKVTKNPDNPVFKGSGKAWDAYGVREAEILKGPEYFHIFYGGRDKEGIFQIGHVRTKDFKTFEPNPYNPILTVAEDENAWDSDGLLTPQVFEMGDYYYMLYAGLNGPDWNKGHCVSGLARAPKH